MGSTKSVLSNIGETLDTRASEFTVLNPPLADVPFTQITDLSGNARQIPDLTRTFKTLGFEEDLRLFQVVLNRKEKGPNGRSVFMPVTKDHRIRFVGLWTNELAGYGPYIQTIVPDDFMEVTFLGTGLAITMTSAGGARDFRASVDGGAESANLFTVHSDVLGSRNYSPHQILTITNNLSFGWHTVKIRMVSAVLSLSGVIILNEASQLTTVRGEILSGGHKYTLGANKTRAHNSGFDGNPVLNGRGGRVVEYITKSGSVGAAIRQTESTALFLTAADHSDEEVIDRANIREFSAVRADDFAAGGTIDRSFTMADNLSTLVGEDVAVGLDNGYDGAISSTSGDSLQFIFYGTGLDFLITRSVAITANVTVNIDGVVVFSGLQSSFMSSPGVFTAKIVSGLPLGTHVVKITSTDAGNSARYMDVITYGPKRPDVPVGAAIYNDYFLNATYSSTNVTGTAVADNLQMPLGTIYKSPAREYIYIGANWQFFPIDTGSLPGLTTTPLANNGQPLTIRFFGTGFLLHLGASVGGTYDYTVTIDGALNATGVAKSNASNLGGGSYRCTTSTTAYQPSRVEFTGLTLGWHTISIPKTAGTGNLTFQGIHVISPIAYPKIRTRVSSSSTGIQLKKDTKLSGSNLGLAKAWARIETAGSGRLAQSHNIAALVKNANGQYVLFFKTPFKERNFVGIACNTFTGGSAVSVGNAIVGPVGENNVGFVEVRIFDNANNLGDPTFFDVVCFGQLINEDSDE